MKNAVHYEHAMITRTLIKTCTSMYNVLVPVVRVSVYVVYVLYIVQDACAELGIL